MDPWKCGVTKVAGNEAQESSGKMPLRTYHREDVIWLYPRESQNDKVIML